LQYFSLAFPFCPMFELKVIIRREKVPAKEFAVEHFCDL